MTKTLGLHLLAEYLGCDPHLLDDVARIERLMTRAAVAAGTTIVRTLFHPFTPHGVSGVVVIMESHLSIHTWPESGYAAVDFYTCGDGDPHKAHELLLRELGAASCELMVVERGLGAARSMRLVSHGPSGVAVGGATVDTARLTGGELC